MKQNTPPPCFWAASKHSIKWVNDYVPCPSSRMVGKEQGYSFALHQALQALWSGENPKHGEKWVKHTPQYSWERWRLLQYTKNLGKGNVVLSFHAWIEKAVSRKGYTDDCWWKRSGCICGPLPVTLAMLLVHIAHIVSKIKAVQERKNEVGVLSRRLKHMHLFTFNLGDEGGREKKGGTVFELTPCCFSA